MGISRNHGTHLSLFVCLLVGFCNQGLASELILNGIYQGKNLFIRNPLGGGRQGFCIQQIFVNEELAVDNPRISALELDLSRFEVNDPLVIRIVHKDDCLPQIINPQVVVFEKRFQFLSLAAEDGQITWITVGEMESGSFSVQKFVDQDWSDLQIVRGKGSFGENQYSLEVAHDMGLNQYRIKWEENGGSSVLSSGIEYLKEKPPITFTPKNVSDKLTISEKVFYEIFDDEGNQITKGTGRVIKLKKLPPGTYFLYLEGNKEVFYKK